MNWIKRILAAFSTFTLFPNTGERIKFEIQLRKTDAENIRSDFEKVIGRW